MDLDLRLLKQMHPLLPATTAVEYSHRAAIALRRRRHDPGTGLAVTCDGHDHAAVLTWDPAPASAGAQLDWNRITEDGAEAVALAIAHVVQQWVVRRRLQRGESADWLLTDPDDRLVALEVSGINGPPFATRLNQKIAQVAKARFPVRSACVVAFGPPAAELATV